jgi:hypothetical protein
MTKQDKESLEQFITKLIDERLITESKEPHFLTKVKSWLMEQGTQRGAIVIIPMLICYFTGMSEQDALKIVYASLLLAFGHNAVTKG